MENLTEWIRSENSHENSVTIRLKKCNDGLLFDSRILRADSPAVHWIRVSLQGILPSTWIRKEIVWFHGSRAGESEELWHLF
jgi:hypothetical protein